MRPIVFDLPAIAVNPPQEPDIDITRKYEEVILMWEEKEAEAVRTQMTMSNIPHKASEAMMSIMTRIAGDAAFEAAYEGIPYDALATPARIRKLWEESETYRTEYATGDHAYNSSKIESTVTKAISAGRDKYNEMMVIHRLFVKGHAKPKPIASPPNPPATTHPEGFCISPDGVPEFWCDEYPDLISHHNERPEPQTNPASEEDPDQFTTYDPAGEIPFSNWDGEEGTHP